MEPREIFELLIKADEKLKYATDANREIRKGQARELVVQALEAAREVGNAGLVAQAERRLSDLG
jgi:predicted DNA-binding protein